MGKKIKTGNQKKGSKWLPLTGSSAYFFASSDDEFKAKHPIGYGFLVLLGMIALLLPAILYVIFVERYDINSPWIVGGFAGGFIFGIGLFNFVAIIIKQYLGHLVSIISFLVGGGLMLLSLFSMGII